MINEKVLRDVLISLATHSLTQYETHAAMVQEIMALRQAIRELDPELKLPSYGNRRHSRRSPPRHLSD